LDSQRLARRVEYTDVLCKSGVPSFTPSDCASISIRVSNNTVVPGFRCTPFRLPLLVLPFFLYEQLPECLLYNKQPGDIMIVSFYAQVDFRKIG